MLAFALSAPISISRPGLTRTPNFARIARPIRIRANPSTVSCSLLEATTLAIVAAGGGALDAVQHALFAPLFDPVDACTPPEARITAWLNFRSAVLLFVISPLALFGASLARGPSTEAGDALTRVLSGYWQASALLLVAVLQHAAGNTGAFAGGLLVQGVIVASLNWWEDLLQEIREIAAVSPDNSLEKIFSVWQPVASVAAAVGMLVQIPFQSCNFETTCACNAWREPPIRLFEILQFSDASALEMLADFGTVCYLGYLAYYLAFVIPRIGRKGRAPRGIFTAPEVLIRGGIIGPWGKREKEGQQ